MFKYAGYAISCGCPYSKINDGENGLEHAWKSRKEDACCGRKVEKALINIVQLVSFYMPPYRDLITPATLRAPLAKSNMYRVSL